MLRACVLLMFVRLHGSQWRRCSSVERTSHGEHHNNSQIMSIEAQMQVCHHQGARAAHDAHDSHHCGCTNPVLTTLPARTLCMSQGVRRRMWVMVAKELFFRRSRHTISPWKISSSPHRPVSVCRCKRCEHQNLLRNTMTTNSTEVGCFSERKPG